MIPEEVADKILGAMRKRRSETARQGLSLPPLHERQIVEEIDLTLSAFGAGSVRRSIEEEIAGYEVTNAALMSLAAQRKRAGRPAEDLKNALRILRRGHDQSLENAVNIEEVYHALSFDRSRALGLDAQVVINLLCMFWRKYADPGLGLPEADGDPSNPLLRFIDAGLEAGGFADRPKSITVLNFIRNHVRKDTRN